MWADYDQRRPSQILGSLGVMVSVSLPIRYRELAVCGTRECSYAGDDQSCPSRRMPLEREALRWLVDGLTS